MSDHALLYTDVINCKLIRNANPVRASDKEKIPLCLNSAHCHRIIDIYNRNGKGVFLLCFVFLFLNSHLLPRTEHEVITPKLMNEL